MMLATGICTQRDGDCYHPSPNAHANATNAAKGDWNLKKMQRITGIKINQKSEGFLPAKPRPVGKISKLIQKRCKAMKYEVLTRFVYRGGVLCLKRHCGINF